MESESTKPEREGKLEQVVKRLNPQQRVNFLDLLEAKASGDKEGFRAVMKKIMGHPPDPGTPTSSE